VKRYGLTESEWTILALRADGLTTKQVAEELGVDQQTVKNHCTNAYRKLRAKRIVEAFIELGWLRGPGYG
jgi:DNA-binding CsgD family transcriptional regulator